MTHAHAGTTNSRHSPLTTGAVLQRLAALRAMLRQRMMASPLGDAPRFVSTLERTYHQLWRRHCEAAWSAEDAVEPGNRQDGNGSGMAADGE